MEQCDVLIVGGGPAGSSCAWTLSQRGADVVVLDRSEFPRDKVCAGWITPPILQSLEMHVDDYAVGRVFQPFTAFLAGMLGGQAILTEYQEPVSYGIRRCEFDDYLLRRSGARLKLGTPIRSIREEGGSWIVNDAISSPILIGAGGHFCPVARQFATRNELVEESVVLAQEAEFLFPVEFRESFPVVGACPEFYFCDDFAGYGWIVRKGDYINVGLGREHDKQLAWHVKKFIDDLRRVGRIPKGIPPEMHGHAYRLRHDYGDLQLPAGLLLIGDALGLADPQSGEGIRPAVESGLLAAAMVLETGGNRSRLVSRDFALRCGNRFGGDAFWTGGPLKVPASIRNAFARVAMRSPWFHRHILLDRWFLHRQQPAL